MRDTASLLTQDWHAVRGLLPDEAGLAALARETGALVRRRGVPSAEALLRLALVHGPGGLSQRETASWAALAGVARITDPSLNYRLRQAGGFLQAVAEALLATRVPEAQAVRWPERRLRIADATCLGRPGGSGADWRVHAVFDLGRGGFGHLELTDGRGAEALDRGAAVPGEVRIADRNYGTGPALARFVAAEPAADYIVRLRWNGLRLLGGVAGEDAPFDLIGYLKALPPEQGRAEVAVRVLPGPGPTTLPARLVIARKPAEAAAASRRWLHREASRRQKRLDPRSLVAADFLILATSLPADAYPAEEVLAAYRLRWQIELAFKRLKSLLHLDRLPSQSDAGARSWLWAHLICALLGDDLSQEFLESSP